MRAQVTFAKTTATMTFINGLLRFSGPGGRFLQEISQEFEGFTPVSGMFRGVNPRAPDQVGAFLDGLESSPTFKLNVMKPLGYEMPPLPEENR